MGKVMVEIEKPLTCGVCPFYREENNRIHNDTFNTYRCTLGYIKTDNVSYKHALCKTCRLGEK